MVRLSRIYTKSGDGGKTSLASGERVSKASLRIKAIGDVDEANSALGLVSVKLPPDSDLRHLVLDIQNDMFDLGADLATSEVKDNKKQLRVSEPQVKFLEMAIDKYNETLHPLNSFVLPGGSEAGGLMHLARAITRRAERSIISLSEVESINPEAIKYINRLSDLLFVLARYINGRNDEVLWRPGGASNPNK